MSNHPAGGNAGSAFCCQSDVGGPACLSPDVRLQLTADADVQSNMKRVALVIIPLAIIFLAFLSLHREFTFPVASSLPI
jgi:hypothetical protein